MDDSLKPELVRIADKLGAACALIAREMPMLTSNSECGEHASLIAFDEVLREEADQLYAEMSTRPLSRLVDDGFAERVDRFTSLVAIKCMMKRLAEDFAVAFETRAVMNITAVPIAYGRPMPKVMTVTVDLPEAVASKKARDETAAARSRTIAALKAMTGN